MKTEESIVSRIVAAEEVWWMGRNFNDPFMGIRIGGYATGDQASAPKVFAAMSITPEMLRPIFGERPKSEHDLPENRQNPYGRLGMLGCCEQARWSELAKLMKKRVHFVHCTGRCEVLGVITYNADGTFKID